MEGPFRNGDIYFQTLEKAIDFARYNAQKFQQSIVIQEWFNSVFIRVLDTAAPYGTIIVTPDGKTKRYGTS